MMSRLVGYGGMAFALVTALVLSGIIARSPRTHDHISNTLSDSYVRTSLDEVGPANLEAILADLPEFSFPRATYPATVPSVHAVDLAHMPDEADIRAEPAITPDEPEVQRVTIRQFEYNLDPDRIELEVGVPVELTVINEGDQVHGIWIPEFAISQDVRSGKSKVFAFTPDKTGRIRFTCSYNLCGTEEEHAKMAGFITVH